MSRKNVFCVAVAIALLCGLAPQLITPSAVWADEAEISDSVTNVSVGSFEELLAAFDSTWEADSGEVYVSLTQDIAQTYGDGDYMGVNLGWTVTLDLNGHTLTLRNDGVRGIQNYGTLIVTGDGTITNSIDETMNESYGLIDNYGGKLTIENGDFLDYGQGGGAVLKNRTVSFDNGATYVQGEMTIEDATIYAYGTAGGNACAYSDGVLTVGDGVTMWNASTDEMHNGYFGSYALTISSGSATLGTTEGNIANPVKVTGNRGGVAVNSGSVVVNNGVYTGNIYYGMWITNNGSASEVEIKYAEAINDINDSVDVEYALDYYAPVMLAMAKAGKKDTIKAISKITDKSEMKDFDINESLVCESAK